MFIPPGLRVDIPTILLWYQGRPVRLAVQLALTPQARATGFMGRYAYGPIPNLLFVFPGAARRTFWMHDTPLPLDIVFIDPNGRITRVATGKPFDDAPIESGEPAMYVLEMPAGWAAAFGLAPGVGVGVTGVPRGI